MGWLQRTCSLDSVHEVDESDAASCVLTSFSLGQGQSQVEMASGPNEFNSVAGHFFFPLIQHFDR